MQENKIKSHRLGAIAGIIAPLFFVGLFTAEGLLRPGYSAFSTYVSALSLGSPGIIQIVNFMVSGTLLFLFGRAVAAANKTRKVSQAGPVLITIFAICLFFSGPFVMDPMGTLPVQASIHGTIHGVLGGIAFLIMPISCFVFHSKFRNDTTWKPFTPWTLFMSIFLSIALALFIFATKLPVGQTIFQAWFGLIQRMVLVPYMLWLFTFSLAFYNRL